jgi:hypothetical protein
MTFESTEPLGTVAPRASIDLPAFPATLISTFVIGFRRMHGCHR